MRTNLRRELSEAIKVRDRVAIAALRSALAAIDNSEAPALAEHDTLAADGVGATEIDRLQLTDEDLHAIIEAEVRQRTDAAAEYEQLGRTEAAERLHAEADVLRKHLPAC